MSRSLFFRLIIIFGLLFMFYGCTKKGEKNIKPSSAACTITFDSDGGSEISQQIVEQGSTISWPNDPIKEGYTFDGWYVDDEKWSFIEFNVSSDLVLKAKWIINQYTLTIKYNDGIFPDSVIKQDYNTPIETADPIRKGYTFKSWDREIPSLMPAEDLTINIVYSCDVLYSINNSNQIVITGVNGNCSDIVILDEYEGKKVVEIGQSAFRYCSELRSITIPNSVTKIAATAFADSSIVSITIGNNVSYIGSLAFSNCDNLTKVNINSLESWCNISFSNDSSNPLYYAHSLYLNNELVTDLVIPDSITNIENNAFNGCSSLKNITIPDSVTSIGYSSFNNCSGLTGLKVGNNLSSIGANAFYNCTSLTEVFMENIKSWCNIAFYNSSSNPLLYANYLYLNNTLVTELIIPDGVISIANYAFNNYGWLLSVSISDSVKSIGKSAFESCALLECVKIGDYVETIGNSAFKDCMFLESLTIGKGVKNIGAYAFANTSLNNIIIPDSVISIDNNAFLNCKGLTSIEIPNSVTSIGDNAFYGCSNLESIIIPNNVTSIGQKVFFECEKLTIYCEVLSKLDGWNSKWNLLKINYYEAIYVPVVWGYNA